MLTVSHADVLSWESGDTLYSCTCREVHLFVVVVVVLVCLFVFQCPFFFLFFFFVALQAGWLME